MLQLHYFPGNASLIVHLVLEELGVPFTLRHVDRAQAAHKAPDYLALNPNGLIPVLVDDATRGRDGGPLVLYETAAICIHLADTHPGAALLPALGTPERPERWADDAAGATVVRAHAETKIGAMLDQIDAELARRGGPWFFGEGFSVVDPYAFVLCRWTRGFARPARSLPSIGPWLERMLARPAVRRAFATEKLAAPFV